MNTEGDVGHYLFDKPALIFKLLVDYATGALRSALRFNETQSLCLPR